MTMDQARSRWSDDAFLDRLRLEGDVPADECVAELARYGSDFGALFGVLGANDSALPADAPVPLKNFFARGLRAPTPDGAEVDWTRLARGEDLFMTHGSCSALVLLAKSLPDGYAAPNLATILVLSGELEHHPFKRLLGTLQTVVNVTSRGGFRPEGRAVVTAVKLRLLHAGVRRIVARRLPEYRGRYGVPVNHEDMLATLMAFSLLVIRGLQQLRVGLEDRDAEDYYYLWRTWGLALGIHPPGEPNSTAYLPANLAEAQQFYDAYARRHYRSASENPEGVDLTRASLLMLQHVFAKTPLRLLGAARVPRVYMQRLLGPDGMIQRGVRPLPWPLLSSRIALALPRLWSWLTRPADLPGAKQLHERFSQACLQCLIAEDEGRVTYLIPESVAELRALTERAVRPRGERRRSQRRLHQAEAGRRDRRTGADRRLAFRQSYWALGR
jgi:hypothetical protein